MGGGGGNDEAFPLQAREREMTAKPGAVKSATGRRALFAWCLFDWANSPFPTVIITFVFAVYFTEGIIGDSVRGTVLWGWAMAASALAVALLGPVFGAIADVGGRRKPWLLACSGVTIAGALLLWFAAPDTSNVLWVLVCVAVANAGFELGMVFYNAMLPGLASAGRVGRLSGWGWALGYAGGLACLVIALFGFVQPETPPFGLDPENAEHVRVVAPLAALWFLAFGWPLFAFVPDRRAAGLPVGLAVRRGLATLWGTLREFRRYPVIFRFLIARLFFIDGLNTVFAFGGIYAGGTFGMDVPRVILFGIALNVTAGLGAFAFAWVDDWLGAKRTLLISIVGLLLGGLGGVLAPSEPWFWAAGLTLGVFIGPTQSASRSMMARLSPPERETEMFGLFALSGKVTAFAGPLLFGWATLAFDSQRAGMATILVFFVVGLALLLPLPDPDRAA
ncbi:MAG: MFS transporter [Alphaproteobacteria bacterium]